MSAIDEDEYEIPLLDQRYFGAGIKRKRIHFVPSTTENAGSALSTRTTTAGSASNKYLSIVMKNAKKDDEADSTITVDSQDRFKDPVIETSERSEPVVCEKCKRTIALGESSVSHEGSLAHQICLHHSYPPSHIDRTRKGLAVLQTQGWDPDERKGLGAGGEGILHPVKAHELPKRVGLGARLVETKPVEKPTKMHAGQVQALDRKKKHQAQSLRDAFYRSEEVERYLGANQTNLSLDLAAFERSRKGG